MSVRFSKDICSNLETSENREWLITNGIGGYGAGTISGILTRRYHGLLIAALKPPLGRTLMLSKLNETATYGKHNYDLYSDRWADKTISPQGYEYITKFFLVGTTPVWLYSFADAHLEKRVWMQQGENTTYIRYTLKQGSSPLKLSLKALVNYRDHHSDTHSNNWQMQISSVKDGIEVKAKPDGESLYLLGGNDNAAWSQNHLWMHNYSLAVEKARGLIYCEDHLLAATGTVTLNTDDSITIIASTNPNPNLDCQSAWKERYKYEQELLIKASRTQANSIELNQSTPPQWISKLVLAANQFIVDRSTKGVSQGKTIIAGYPWFSDWSRVTMISLSGLTLTIGRPNIARNILRTFAKYIKEGMLPNVFPDSGAILHYHAVDPILWYFEAIFSYYQHTEDKSLIKELFPILDSIIADYCQGTFEHICQDSDGLLYTGDSSGLPLTWMDAEVDGLAVTPRYGKPIEINALWYNSLVIMEQLAQILEYPHQEYTQLSTKVKQSFQRFWNDELGYCYDVIDTPKGNDDDSLRPNQVFAVSLPSLKNASSLLTPQQEKSVVDILVKELVTSCGLRSLAPSHANYQGQCSGDRQERNRPYHQGTIWAWLIGHFIQAHLKVYQQPDIALDFLTPMAELLETGCIGKIGEVFDGDFPFTPRGCFSQAWSVAEVLRSWQLIGESKSK